MKEAKEISYKGFGKSLLKVTGGILVAGTILTAITKKVCDTILDDKEKEKKEENNDAK